MAGYPFSKAATVAAAIQITCGGNEASWEKCTPEEQERLLAGTARCLWAAINAWEPSEAQLDRFQRAKRGTAMSVYMGENGDTRDARCIKAGILAAIHTEAQE